MASIKPFFLSNFVASVTIFRCKIMASCFSEELHERAEYRWWMQTCRGRHWVIRHCAVLTVFLLWRPTFPPRRSACVPAGTIKRKRRDIRSYLNNKITQSIIHVQKCPARGYQMHFWSLGGYIFTPCLMPVPTIYKRKAGVRRRRILRRARVHLFTRTARLLLLGSVRRKCRMDIWSFWVEIFHKAKKMKINVVHPR